MLTTFDDDEYVRDALQAGARGYLLKDLPPQDLAHAVHAVSQGVCQLDASVIERMKGTVKNHLSNIFSRLGLRDRTQAMMYAREHGLL